MKLKDEIDRMVKVLIDFQEEQSCAEKHIDVVQKSAMSITMKAKNEE